MVGEVAISSVQNNKIFIFSLLEQSVIITERIPHTLKRIHACFQFRFEFLDLHCQLEVRNVGNVGTAFPVTELVSRSYMYLFQWVFNMESLKSIWISLLWITVMFYFNGDKPQSPFDSVITRVRWRCETSRS